MSKKETSKEKAGKEEISKEEISKEETKADAIIEKSDIDADCKLICGSRVVKMCGVEEKNVQEKILDLVEANKSITFSITTIPGEVHLRLATSQADEKAIKDLLKPVMREIKVRFGKQIYTTDENKTLEEAIYELLKEQNLTVTTAESCTGGALSARLVNVAGVSEVFKQGYITYSNKAKRQLLHVKKSTLKSVGAVSEKTAKEMAQGANFMSKSDVSLAVTGIAGPDGGTKEKPVGLVYIACGYGRDVQVRKFIFSGSRSEVREQSVVQALVLLRDCVLENYKTK
ncbi:MAG: nicotinamide-nucleotide amidohydrolase family protein [Lachnospiraceae bacterium]|nr:nicotinamide-nucleotide amidohydrolase family protein [Lachnospiraceae bacterium]MDD3615101.1 nicotinamide-nucleotide amidohydrolase family protein [Lachnospiraceae bacterium]